MADLKAVYAAVDEPSALDVFSERWDKKYPKISQSWRENRANLSTYFKYPQEVVAALEVTNGAECEHPKSAAYVARPLAA